MGSMGYWASPVPNPYSHQSFLNPYQIICSKLWFSLSLSLSHPHPVTHTPTLMAFTGATLLQLTSSFRGDASSTSSSSSFHSRGSRGFLPLYPLSGSSQSPTSPFCSWLSCSNCLFWFHFKIVGLSYISLGFRVSFLQFKFYNFVENFSGGSRKSLVVLAKRLGFGEAMRTKRYICILNSLSCFCIAFI